MTNGATGLVEVRSCFEMPVHAIEIEGSCRDVCVFVCFVVARSCSKNHIMFYRKMQFDSPIERLLIKFIYLLFECNMLQTPEKP